MPGPFDQALIKQCRAISEPARLSCRSSALQRRSSCFLQVRVPGLHVERGEFSCPNHNALRSLARLLDKHATAPRLPDRC